MEVFNSCVGHKVPHGGTFNGNPLTMTAGYATMELLTPDAIDRLNLLGDRMRERVMGAFASAGVDGQATGAARCFAFCCTRVQSATIAATIRRRVSVSFWSG